VRLAALGFLAVPPYADQDGNSHKSDRRCTQDASALKGLSMTPSNEGASKLDGRIRVSGPSRSEQNYNR